MYFLLGLEKKKKKTNSGATKWNQAVGFFKKFKSLVIFKKFYLLLVYTDNDY